MRATSCGTYLTATQAAPPQDEGRSSPRAAEMTGQLAASRERRRTHATRRRCQLDAAGGKGGRCGLQQLASSERARQDGSPAPRQWELGREAFLSLALGNGWEPRFTDSTRLQAHRGPLFCNSTGAGAGAWVAGLDPVSRRRAQRQRRVVSFPLPPPNSTPVLSSSFSRPTASARSTTHAARPFAVSASSSLVCLLGTPYHRVSFPTRLSVPSCRPSYHQHVAEHPHVCAAQRSTSTFSCRGRVFSRSSRPIATAVPFEEETFNCPFASLRPSPQLGSTPPPLRQSLGL